MALTRLGSKAITSVENTAINLDAAEIPNLDAAKITSGQFADARIAASNVSQHATSFDDNKIVNDISTLALRQASNENKAAYNTNSMYVDVFQDSTGITNLTNATRTTDEFVASVVLGTASEFDYNGQSTKAKALTSSQMTGTNNVYYEIDNDGDSSQTSSKFVIPSIALANNNYWFHNQGNTGTNAYWQIDYQSNRIFSDTLRVGKTNTWGDVKRFKFEYSTDGSSWSNWDMSNTSSGGVAYGTGAGQTIGGVWTAGDSSGHITISQHGTSSIYHSVATINGVPQITARYIRIYVIEQWSGTADPACGLSSFAPYERVLVANATGSFENNAITAPSSVSSMGAIITYQDQAGTNALNTDIVLKLSADGGSNYTTATLAAMPDFASGIKMAKVNDLSVTAGTQLKYKLEFANQANGTKEARIRGISLQY